MEGKKVDPISVRFRPQIEAARKDISNRITIAIIETLAEQKRTSRNEIIEMLCELGLELNNLIERKFGIHYKGLSERNE